MTANPDRLPEIVGHVGPRASLARADRSCRSAPAIFLVGPAGIGKALVAWELAAAAHCAAGYPPCRTCRDCEQVAARRHPFVHELVVPEEKSLIPIEDVHRTLTQVRLRPGPGKRRVLLIDDADLLSRESRDALLKTIEEPPEYLRIVLVSSRPGRLPATIRSRCQTIAFGPLAETEVAEVLAARGFAPKDAALLAALSGGSAGEALALAETGLADADGLARDFERLRAGDVREVSDRWQARAKKYRHGDEDERDAHRRHLAAVMRLCRLALRPAQPGEPAFLAAWRASAGAEGLVRQLDLLLECDQAIQQYANPKIAVEQLVLDFTSDRA